MSLRLSKVAEGVSPSATLKLNAETALLKQQGIHVISLGAGEPDFDTPVHIRQAAAAAIEAGCTRYTDAAGMPALRQAIAAYIHEHKRLRYTPDEIIAGAGAKQVLFEALLALINPGDEVLLPAPFWLSYPEMIRMAGGVPVIIPSSECFLPDVRMLEAAVTKKTRALILNTPCNPSGAVWPRKLLEDIMRIAQKHDFPVISDEIYETLIYDDHTHLSPAALGKDAFGRTIVVSGLSKSYAMTGWRVGYAAGPHEIIAAMSALQSHAAGSCNTIAQHAALAALTGPQDCVQYMAAAFAHRRSVLLNALHEAHLSPAVLPHGAFYMLLDIRPYLGKTLHGQIIANDIDFSEALLCRQHTAVIPGTPFGAQGFVRLSYAASEQAIVEGVRRIGEFVCMLQ